MCVRPAPSAPTTQSQTRPPAPSAQRRPPRRTPAPPPTQTAVSIDSVGESFDAPTFLLFYFLVCTGFWGRGGGFWETAWNPRHNVPIL